ncbi:MAG: tRNA (adenosine(37)-N6)-threonylcarbamoyltransferase complex dimerization subunit type 1 TsaB [Candidatus Omnitrophica bacterium]|nr:tRNA (adenosine(37)-N6)-threonylcarbamoyltransferase complex dimerization subunit type 1 TsaB [Candidatus Omnitrophota bacterium]
MKLLSFDTSSKIFSLALSDNGKIVRYRNLELGKQLSSDITKYIRDILKSVDWTLNDLDGFAVGVGPGSFTSLRVGLATVKALALALDKPIVGICSLDLIAMNASRDFQHVCVINDARRDLVYAAFYDLTSEGNFRRGGDYLLTDLRTVITKIKKKFAILGDAVTMIEEADRVRLLKLGCEISEDERRWYPKAQNLSKAVEERFQNKKFDDPNKLVPMYLHADDCQINRGNR